MKIKLTKQDKRNIELIIAANKCGGGAPPGYEDTPKRVIANRLKYAMQHRVAEAARWCGLSAIREIGLDTEEVKDAAILRLGCKVLSEKIGIQVEVTWPDPMTGKGDVVVGDEAERIRRSQSDTDIPF